MSFCYKDKTFCSSDCVQKSCHRYFGDIQRAAAKAWWERGRSSESIAADKHSAPIAFSDFSVTCPVYLPPTDHLTTEELNTSRAELRTGDI